MIQCLSHKLIYIIFFWYLPIKQHFIGFFNTTIKKHYMPQVSLTQEEHSLLLSPSNEHNFLN